LARKEGRFLMAVITFKYEGREVVVERAPLRQVHEGEKALGVGLMDSDSARLMVLLFVGLRRESPEKSAVAIADEIMEYDLFDLDSVEEDETPFGPQRIGEALGNLPPTGHPLSAVSE
jgi:hypothetical protein